MSRLHFLIPLVHHPDAFGVLLLVVLCLLGVAGAYFASRIDLTMLMISAVILQLFSGNWSLMGIPVPLDRVVFVLTLGALLLKGTRHLSSRRLVWRPLHIAMLCAVTWVVVSGLIVGTITGHLGFYAFLDRFGLVPFVLFTLAPLFFGSERQRRLLLAALVGMGLYLGLTGCMEGIHLYKLIFPRYIANPNLGIQWGRARGPILESTGDGFCTFVGGVAAVIGLQTWRSAWARRLCYATIAVDLATEFFTLTRSVWIGTVVGIVAVMMLRKKTRRIVIPVLLAGIIVVCGTLALSPSVRSEVVGRTESQSPVWDRQNTDLAALRIIEEKPLTGVGWENFINVSTNYMRQQPTYPITGEGIEVHNVFLSHAAELGIPGLLLWLLALGGAVRRGLFPGRTKRRPDRAQAGHDADLEMWRLGGFAIVLFFLVIADLAPVSQALPNSLLWLWLGVTAAPYTSRLRLSAIHRRGLPQTLPFSPPRPLPSAPELQPVHR